MKVTKLECGYDKERKQMTILSEKAISLEEALDSEGDALFEVDDVILNRFMVGLAQLDDREVIKERKIVSRKVLKNAWDDFTVEAIDVDSGITVSELSKDYPFPEKITVRSVEIGVTKNINIQVYAGFGKGYQVSCGFSHCDGIYQGIKKVSNILQEWIDG